ncbi:MAG: hypothetical protein ABIP63_04230, partial [Thermoanaerobaculia bacterium]
PIMFARMLITFVIVLHSSTAGADATASPRWQSVAPSPRPGLPAVSVQMGEPGPYISTKNAALTLTALTAERPFDGYIGFHFEVRTLNTLDTPVIFRTVLGSHGRRTFSTWVQLNTRGVYREGKPVLKKREVVIEWRDASARLLAKRNLGPAPWSDPVSLRITRGAASDAPALTGGSPTYDRSAASLSDRAQWYSGFSAVIIPVDLWLDLPMPVREAIFGSNVRTLFFGSPRSGQTWTALDRAMIPVEFEWKPGSYTAPWPYRPKAVTVPVEVSWRARPEALIIGPGQSPYLVSSVSAYGAEEAALTREVPIAATRGPGKGAFSPRSSVLRLTAEDILREYRPLLVMALLILLVVFLWLTVRRTPRIAALVVTLGATAAVLAARDWIHPVAGVHLTEDVRRIGPGVSRRTRSVQQYGASPLAERRLSSSELRTAVAGIGEVLEDAEVRTSETAPGHGTMLLARSAWDSTSRWTVRREMEQTVSIRIRGRDAKTLVFDYQSSIPANYVSVEWEGDGRNHFGQGHLLGSMSGTATVVAGIVEPTIGQWAWAGSRLGPFQTKTRISLIEQNRERTRSVVWTDPATSSAASLPFSMFGTLHPSPNGQLSCDFSLPTGSKTAQIRLTIKIVSTLGVKQVTVAGPGGTVTAVLSNEVMRSGMASYVIPLNSLGDIAPGGGIVTVTVDHAETGGVSWSPQVWLELRENAHE